MVFKTILCIVFLIGASFADCGCGFEMDHVEDRLEDENGYTFNRETALKEWNHFKAKYQDQLTKYDLDQDIDIIIEYLDKPDPSQFANEIAKVYFGVSTKMGQILGKEPTVESMSSELPIELPEFMEE